MENTLILRQPSVKIGSSCIGSTEVLGAVIHTSLNINWPCHDNDNAHNQNSDSQDKKSCEVVPEAGRLEPASQAKLSLTSGGAAHGERLADAVTVAGGLRVGAAGVHALGYAHPRGEALPAVRVARLVAIAELVGHGSHRLQLAVAGQQDDEQAADSNSFLPLHFSAQHRFTPAHATELVLAVRKRSFFFRERKRG
jgi:hypothetical protein